jgi:hypothetical protein
MLLGTSCVGQPAVDDGGPSECVAGEFCVGDLVCVDGFCVEPGGETGGDGDGDTGDGDGDTGDGDGDPGDGDGDPGGDGDGDPSDMCGNGTLDDGEQCDGDDLGDNSTCADVMLGTASEPLSCNDACMYEFSECSGCGDGVVTDPEQCEGADLDGQTCMSLGFDDGMLACADGCVFDTDSCYECGDSIQQGQEQCDGADFDANGCDDFDSVSGEPFDSGSLLCTDQCMIETSNCSLCGDGVKSGAEVCDGSDLGGETCLSEGHDGGVLGCYSDCTDFYESDCSNCGDGVINGDEQCDGNNLAGETCQTQGFDGGQLGCNQNCGFNTGACIDVPNPYTICNEQNLGLPDNMSTQSVINVPENGTITDVNVSSNIVHPWVGELDITINHGGATRTLMDRPGVPASMLGCQWDDIHAVFDTGGPANPETTCSVWPPALLSPPNFNPTQSLVTYNGMNMNGDWTLTTTDHAGSNAGTLTQWCLIITWQ